jgi:transmembrane 9 superfamily protein 2/4
MGISSECSLLCESANDRQDLDNFKWMIDNEYKASWMLDDLPSGYRLTTTHKEKFSEYQSGFPIGYKEGKNEYYIYNHVNIIIKTSEPDSDGNRSIVGFLVEPLSMMHADEENLACKSENFRRLFFEPKEDQESEQVIQLDDELAK